MMQNKYIALLSLSVTAYLAYLFSSLAWFDSLSSFANDSVHYLVMARHYSPWQDENAAIAAAWPLQDFPPFFPWLLAITGAAHSFLYAHLLVIVIGLCSLYFYYLLCLRWLENKAWAILPIMVFALSPGFLLGLQGILSESLFLLLTVIFIWYFIAEEKLSTKQVILCALLLTTILLTRTIGFALLLAIVAQGFFSSLSEKKIQLKPAYIAVLASVMYFLLLAIWGPVKESHYFDILIPYITGEGQSVAGPTHIYNFSYVFQLKSLLDNWTSFWIIFWTDEFSFIYLVIMMLLLAALSGLSIRLYKNKYDAWYVLFYILILTAWPHPGQMFRLILPIMPLLLLYAGYAIMKLSQLEIFPQKKEWVPATFYLFILASILPSHMFIHTRAATAAENNMVPIYEYFRRADPRLADKELMIHNQMFEDFRRLEKSIQADEKVIYFLPSYVALLSNRTGVISNSLFNPGRYKAAVRESNAAYIFVTRVHPRKNNLKHNGLDGIENLSGWTKVMWCSELPDAETVSCLFKVTR